MFIFPRTWMSKVGHGLLLSSLLLFPSIAAAQVKVSPMVIMTETEQGQANGVITLTNQSTQESRIRLSAKPFTYNADGFEELEMAENDLSEYLFFSPRELLLQPGQVQRVRIIIRMLPSMAEGEYRAVIFAEPLVEEADPNTTTVNQMSVRSRIGVTLYVKHGDVFFDLMPQSAQYNPESKQIEITVGNAGNGTARPEVQWQLSQQEGEVVASGAMDSITVIAEGDRSVPIKLPSNYVLSPGNYRLTGEFRMADPSNPIAIPFGFDVTVPE